MSVPQYTTPTFTLTFSEQSLDLTQAVNVYVTFKSGEYTLTKSGDSLTVAEKSISVQLSQEETANFQQGGVKIQANWTTALGKRVSSEVVSYKISEQLLMAVIE